MHVLVTLVGVIDVGSHCRLEDWETFFFGFSEFESLVEDFVYDWINGMWRIFLRSSNEFLLIRATGLVGLVH